MLKRAGFWLKKHTRLTLVFLYVTVILVPGCILGVLALRALDREEAYVEKTLENSLLSEVTHSVAVIQDELEKIQGELNESLVFPNRFYPYSRSPLDITDKPLIDTVFVLSDKREILWPNEDVSLNEKEKEFLYWNAPLMLDKVTIPVVKNIALEYRDTIINNPQPEALTRNDISPATVKDELSVADAKMNESPKAELRKTDVSPASADSEKPAGQIDDRGGTGNRDESKKSKAVGATNLPPAESNLSLRSSENQELSVSPQRALLNEEKANRQAIDIFEQNKPIQEKIYKQAEEEGKEVLTRTTLVSPKTNTTQTNERSQFIVSPSTFSDIIATKTAGYIPRLLGGEFSILYWKKNKDGYIIGCVVNLDAVSERILETLPSTITPARVLVVLNNRAEPLHAPEDMSLDWRLPFVAREIHEALPRWEVAAYIADPSYIASKAEATTSVLWVLTAFLLFAIAGGGIIIIKILLSELALAQKKTNLVTNVSHELKTPLTSIRLFAEMLQADIKPVREKRKEYSAMLVSETERLSRLINNVLDFSKMTQGKMHYDKKTLDLVALCRDVVACEKIRLEKEGFRVRFSAQVKKLPFFGCRESLTQVLINLISNSEKYASEGKKIDIRIEKSKTDVALSVMDRGPGIPAWASRRIFKEFFRVDDSLTAKTSGSGLGLTISRIIVKDHGGAIAYLPRPDGGSIFRISFPGEK